MMCLKTCEQTDASDIGLTFISYLKRGETFASFQSLGVFPCFGDAEKIRVSMGVSHFLEEPQRYELVTY